MALKSSSPINLAALRQDYSMLPRIAAVKAQADQQMIGAIQSGLQKRKERIEKQEKNALNERLLQDLIDSDPDNKIVPPGMTNKELAKIITLPETIAHRQTLEAANKTFAKEAQLIQAARNAAQKLGLPPGAAEANPRGVLEAAMKAQIESLKGPKRERKIQEITNPDGTKRYVIVDVEGGTFTDITKQAAAPRPSQAVLPGGLSASRVDPQTGRPPAQDASSADLLISSPSPADKKAQQEALFDDVRQNIKSKSQTKTGAFRVTPEIIKRVSEDYKGVLTPEQVSGIAADLTEEYNLRGRDLIQKFSKDDPKFKEYLTALSKLPEDTKLEEDFFGSKKKFKTEGFFDLRSNEEYNELIMRNPEIAQAAGIPDAVYDLIKVKRMSEEVQEKTEKTLPDGTTVFVY